MFDLLKTFDTAQIQKGDDNKQIIEDTESRPKAHSRRSSMREAPIPKTEADCKSISERS